MGFYKRADKVSIDEIIEPTIWSLNKRSWKIKEIQSIKDRLLFKVEVLGDDFPVVNSDHNDPEEYIGNIIELNTPQNHKFYIM